MHFHIGLVLFACFLYGACAVISKYALQHDVQKIAELPWLNKIKAALTNKYWLLGWIMGVAANLIIIQVQSFADISIVYPILNFAYIFTLILGFIFLKERLNLSQWMGVITAIIGTFLLLLIKDPSTGNAMDFSHLGLMSLISVALITCLMVMARRDRRQINEIYYSTCAGIAFGNAEIFLKVNTNLIIDQNGTFSLLSLESLAAFVSLWPIVCIGVFSLIGFVTMQIAFASGDVSVSVPLVTVTQRPITLFASFFVFEETFPPLKIIGILVLLLSMLIIARSTTQKVESRAIEIQTASL